LAGAPPWDTTLATDSLAVGAIAPFISLLKGVRIEEGVALLVSKWTLVGNGIGGK
jgi:hypothetical protein